LWKQLYSIGTGNSATTLADSARIAFANSVTCASVSTQNKIGGNKIAA
jgi:hypothetical protein